MRRSQNSTRRLNLILSCSICPDYRKIRPKEVAIVGGTALFVFEVGTIITLGRVSRTKFLHKIDEYQFLDGEHMQLCGCGGLRQCTRKLFLVAAPQMAMTPAGSTGTVPRGATSR